MPDHEVQHEPAPRSAATSAGETRCGRRTATRTWTSESLMSSAQTVVRPDRNCYPCPAAPTRAGRGKPAIGVRTAGYTWPGWPRSRAIRTCATSTPFVPGRLRRWLAGSDGFAVPGPGPSTDSWGSRRNRRGDETFALGTGLCMSSMLARRAPCCLWPGVQNVGCARVSAATAANGRGMRARRSAACGRRGPPSPTRPLRSRAARARGARPRCRRRGPWSRA